MFKTKKLTLTLLVSIMFMAFVASMTLFAVNAETSASPFDEDGIIGQSTYSTQIEYTDLEKLEQKYFKTFDIKKDGTGTGEDEVSYSGLVPYGTANTAIDLGTYDLSACWPTGAKKSAADIPLFSVLPQKAWSSTAQSADDSTASLDFTIDLVISDSKTINFRFTRPTISSSEEKDACVLVGTNGGDAKATKTGVWSSGTDYAISMLPFYFDGTPSVWYDSGTPKLNAPTGPDGNLISKPIPIEIGLCFGEYNKDFCINSTRKTDSDYLNMTKSDGSKAWDFTFQYLEGAVGADELKNVKVQIRFDNDVAEEDAYVMITSIGSTMFNAVEDKAYTKFLPDTVKTVSLGGVNYAGIVPYGNAGEEVVLGTFDLSSCYPASNQQMIGLDTPFFSVLPTLTMSDSTTRTEDDKNKFFTIKISDGTKAAYLRFAEDDYDDAILYSSDNATWVAKSNKWQNAAPKNGYGAITRFKFRMDGTQMGDIYGSDGAKITAPTPISFYSFRDEWGTTRYATDCTSDIANCDKKAATDTTLNRYFLANSDTAMVGFGKDSLKNITFSIIFDNDVAEEDAYVMFTKIGNYDFSDHEKLNADTFTDVDYPTYKITSTNNTITFNRKIDLSDNTALDKLVEFETVALPRVIDSFKSVTVTLKGAEKSVDIKLSQVDNDDQWMNCAQWLVGIYDTGSTPDVMVAERRGTPSLGEVTYEWPRYHSYHFNGRDGNGGSADENGNAISRGQMCTPKFAIYYDAETTTLYSDFGDKAEGRYIEVGGVRRYPFYTLTFDNYWGKKVNPLFKGFGNELVDVIITVELEENVPNAYLKVCAIDGQDLELNADGKIKNPVNYAINYVVGADATITSLDHTTSYNFYNQNITKLPEVSRKYNSLTGWVITDTENAITAGALPFAFNAKPLSITAQYAPKNYTVKYNLNFDSAPSISDVVDTYVNLLDCQLYTISGNEFKPDDANYAYAFDGWYDAATDGNKITDIASIFVNDDVAGDEITLYAHWAEAYNVTFKFDNGTSDSIEKVVVGEKATQPANPLKTGYTFDIWALEGQTTEYDFNTAINAHTTIKALYTINTYAVKLSDGIPANEQNFPAVPYGTKLKDVAGIKLAIPEKNGYKQTAPVWMCNGAVVDGDTVVEGDMIITAKYTKDTFKVTFDVDGGSAIEEISVQFESLLDLEGITTTKNGYSFVKWTVNGADFDPAVKITGDITLKAVWAAKTYKVAIVVDDNKVGEVEVKFGEKISLDAINAIEGVDVKKVYSDEEMTKEFNFDTAIEGNISVYASAKGGCSSNFAGDSIIVLIASLVLLAFVVTKKHAKLNK